MYEGFIINFLELGAAFSGFYYLRKNKNSELRLFVYFLVLTVFVDALGSYTSLYDKLNFLESLRGTRFEQNIWLYNGFIIVSLFFYILFYRKLSTVKKHKKVLSVLLVVSTLVVIFDLYIERSTYFQKHLDYSFIWTTIAVFICVVLYLYELLVSNKILKFYSSALFYISIGLLVWWLTLPPMILYMPYYGEHNPNIIKIRTVIFLVANVFLYGNFIIGFLWGKEK